MKTIIGSTIIAVLILLLRSNPGVLKNRKFGLSVNFSYVHSLFLRNWGKLVTLTIIILVVIFVMNPREKVHVSRATVGEKQTITFTIPEIPAEFENCILLPSAWGFRFFKGSPAINFPEADLIQFDETTVDKVSRLTQSLLLGDKKIHASIFHNKIGSGLGLPKNIALVRKGSVFRFKERRSHTFTVQYVRLGDFPHLQYTLIRRE